MASNRARLTAEVRVQICSYIRAGAHPNMAAEAAGVPVACFERWLEMGQRFRPRKAYRQLWREVETARAQARVAAEASAFKEKPLDWLRCGPGKETPVMPGWTGTARATYQGEAAIPNLVRSPDFHSFVHLLRRVLAPYPEALAALTKELGMEIRRWQDNRKSRGNQP